MATNSTQPPQSPVRRQPRTDRHTAAASVVAANQYFVIADVSQNDVTGLLVGTEVQKIANPQAVESKYWHNSLYWSVLVQAPNGETRRVSCDCLTPRKNNRYFLRQQRAFNV